MGAQPRRETTSDEKARRKRAGMGGTSSLQTSMAVERMQAEKQAMERAREHPSRPNLQSLPDPPAETHWVGDGGGLAFSHGFYAYWCERCAVEGQLEAAKASAARIPSLEQRLAELTEPAHGA